mgnify:CR=1 FL=1
MKIFSFIYVFSVLFVSQNVFAGTCSDYPERRGLNYIEVENGIKILSTGEASVPVDDIDVEAAAYDEAKLLAKSEIASFLGEMVSAEDSIASEMMSNIKINGESQSKSVDIEKAKKQIKKISSNAEALIKGATVIGDCYTPGKVLRVTIGIKPETISAAEKLKNSMKRNSNSSNSNSFSNPGGLNNMEGYSNTDRLNSF